VQKRPRSDPRERAVALAHLARRTPGTSTLSAADALDCSSTTLHRAGKRAEIEGWLRVTPGRKGKQEGYLPGLGEPPAEVAA
jgi:hypothetical protein